MNCELEVTTTGQEGYEDFDRLASMAADLASLAKDFLRLYDSLVEAALDTEGSRRRRSGRRRTASAAARTPRA